MTNQRQVLSATKKFGLVTELESRGFCHVKGRGLCFHREYGEKIHQILSGGVSYGANLKFSITCIVEELDPIYMESFPDNVVMLCGGGFGDEYFTAELWEVDEITDPEGLAASILEVFDGYPSKWFDSIATRADFVNALYPHVREEYEKLGAITRVLEAQTSDL